ncbi:MAG TPA: type II toxin-antitoxin system ParD family antitoxin [Gemmataceae bacterium]|nr:type II toxin-antitoxin system ParD family antitoxin [Gemmataceae bacterium]
MHISLPPGLKEWVEEQVHSGGYSTASEYIRALLREEQDRRLRLGVEAKLREAIDSGEPMPVTEATWKASAKKVEERLRATKKRRAADGKNR